MTALIIITFGLLLCQESKSSLFDWFGWVYSDKAPMNNAPLLEIPFEELGPEDKFLVEASKITGLKLSQLDACQHKLIMKIKASCGTLSDEDLSKLAVNLLNCQADIEGRKTFPCTEDMSLRDCTRDMDADSWNSYHIMTNRARAVCYAARQEQFRALAEITINRLISTTRTHLEQMTAYNANQEKLEKATELALEKISRNQHDVLSTYSRLRRLESEFAATLVNDKTGLEQLGKLIENEQNEITKILTDFKTVLEETGKEYKKQKQMKSIEHDKVLKDLGGAQLMAKEIYKHLGDIQAVSDENFKKSSSHFDDAFKSFSAMNKSLNEIYSRLHSLEQLLEDKTSLIFSYFGKNGENIDVIFCAAFHLLCISLLMIMCSVLELPRHLKVVLIFIASTNIYLSLSKNENAVQVPILYLSLAVMAAVDVAALQIYKTFKKRKTGKNTNLLSRHDNFKQDKIYNGLHRPQSKVDDWLTEKFPESWHEGLKNGGLLHTPISKDNDEVSLSSRASLRSRRKGVSPARSVAESSASARRSTCSALRLNGLRCKLPPVTGQSTCRVHGSSR